MCGNNIPSCGGRFKIIKNLYCIVHLAIFVRFADLSFDNLKYNFLVEKIQKSKIVFTLKSLNLEVFPLLLFSGYPDLQI